MNSIKNTRILIADDEGTMRSLLSSILKAEGYGHIEQVSDGQKALDHLRQSGTRVDLAFLDIDMPAFSGIEVMSMGKEAQASCFWVIVTGHSAIENVMAALGAGAGGFIVKPYTPQKIHDVLLKFERATAR
ncbi:MAG: response regulator [Pseudomonadota bacterium]